MTNVTISVVIPLYNKVKHIVAALDSIASQAYPASEIVIVDDGSTDNGAEIAKARAANLDIPVRILHQKNQGVSVARNNGVLAATSEYIAFLDADDTWLPLFLDEMVNLIETFPYAGLYASRYQCIAEEGEYFDASINMDLIAKNGFNPNGMLLSNYFEVASQGDLPFMVSSLVLAKSFFKRIGGFPVGEKIGEDQELFANAALKGPIAYSPNINLLYATVAENKATHQHVPSEECPFSVRLAEKVGTQQAQDATHILKYCAAHLCHLAKLNIRTGHFNKAKKLLADSRCALKPKHRIGLYLAATIGQSLTVFKRAFS